MTTFFNITYTDTRTVKNIFTMQEQTISQELTKEFRTNQEAIDYMTEHNISASIFTTEREEINLQAHVYRFNNSDILDDTVNYETLNFIKKNSALTKTVIDNIERDTITREFYLSYDKPSNTYNDIVLKEHKIYLKNADNFPEYQILRIEYYSKTDEIIHTKELENPLEFVKSREIEKQLRDFKIAKISQLFIDEAKAYNNPKAFYLGYLMSEILNEPQDKYLKFNPYTFLYYLENIESVITASPITQEDKDDLIYLMTKIVTIDNKTGTIAHQMLDILDIVEIEVNP